MSQPFTAASHHELLVLLVQVTILLCTARLMGELAKRLKQPTVVGEILAGILLGPSLLSSLVPALSEWIVPQTPVQGYLLETIGLLGALFLMLITGLETDISLIRRQARTAIGVSLGGITACFASGFGLGLLIPDSLLVNTDQRVVFALFLATATAISAIPVIAKVLMDMNLLRRTIGQTIIAAGMSDDTIGWIILSVISGLAAGEAVTFGTISQAVAEVALFMIFSFTVGQFLVRRLVTFVRERMTTSDRTIALMVALMLGWGAFAQALNIESVLGAFVMGILLAQTRSIPQETIHVLERLALGVFAPIFFAIAGLKVNLLRLADAQILMFTIALIIVATVGKMVGTYAGARWIGGRDHWTALSFGAGLNARGAIGIIIGTVGLSLGILSQDVFSMIVVMSIVTTIFAPSALRWTLSHLQPSTEEIQSQRRDELNPNSLFSQVRRVLLPVRVRPQSESASAQRIEARLLERLNARASLSVTLMSVGKPEGKAEAQKYVDTLGELFTTQPVTRKVSVGDNVGGLILDESQKDYDLMVLGASENGKSSEVLFSPMVDFLMRSSPCPTLLVQGGDVEAGWSPRRIVVASNGSASSRRAAEIAFAVASAEEDEVLIVQVVERTMADYQLDSDRKIFDRHMQTAQRNVDALRELGQLSGIVTNAEVKPGREPEKIILNTAKEWGADLIVLGTSISIASDRLYLGPRVERILANAPCPVVVINA